jgi:hypothetical protein
MTLPPEKRVYLMEEHDASLPEDEDAEFLALVDARVAASDAGAPCTPGDEVFAELLGERSSNFCRARVGG